MLDQVEAQSDGAAASRSSLTSRQPSRSEFVVEAVPEKVELKKAVLADVERFVSADAIIATNTSGIPISTMAEDMSNPERFIGMHWSNPPHLIPMIEVIKGERTDDTVQSRLIEIIRAFAYEAVVEKETPGFVENRVLYAILRECLALLDESIVTQEDLDTCVKWGISYKLSVVEPMRLLDIAELDVYQNVSSYLNAQLDNSASVPDVITQLTAESKLRMKSSSEMYEYRNATSTRSAQRSCADSSPRVARSRQRTV